MNLIKDHRMNSSCLVFDYQKIGWLLQNFKYASNISSMERNTIAHQRGAF